MPRVIVFHFTKEGRLPKLSKEELRDVRAKFLEALKGYPDVTFHGTYVNEEGMGICDWEAPSADVVREIVEKVLGAPPTDPTIVVEKVL